MKTIILGVTGGIAAYKSCEIVSRFRRLGYDVRVVMTKNAAEFVTPLTFESISHNKVVIDTFDKTREFEIEHISYAELASAFVVAPATANFIAKIASGICDDMLSTTVAATKRPVFVCPAMNVNMYENPVTQSNIEKLTRLGYRFIGPESGMLACGVSGAGRMSEPEDIVAEVDKFLTPIADYRGKTVLVTAGATREAIDGVRFISNRSSGKMGAAIADAAAERGAKVIFIAGYMTSPLPANAEIIRVGTTMEMYEKTLSEFRRADVVVMAAAPGDYKVGNYSPSKIKAEKLTLELVKNPDIAAAVGKDKGATKLVVFAAETEDLIKNATKKLKAKNADLIVSNDVTTEGAGFDVDTNVATLIEAGGAMTALEKMSKRELADVILDTVKNL